MSVPGNIDFNSNSNFLSNGTLNLGGNVNFNSNALVTLQGNTFIEGTANINSNTTINFSGQFNIAGNLQVNSNGGINAINSNQCSNIEVNGSFNNNGSIVSNYLSNADSPLFINKIPTANAIVGDFNVGSCPSYDCFETQQISTSDGIDVIYIYRCPGQLKVPDLQIDQILLDVMVAVVGGGAGGGRGEAAGGGGAGEITTVDGLSLTIGQVYPVAVGSGGPGSSSTSNQGQDGFLSSFFGITSIGGGGGGSTSSIARNGRSGGSGGGGGANNSPGQGQGSKGLKVGNIGNPGGDGNRGGNGNQLTGGGGGGAGSAGINASNNQPGTGGNGLGLNILTNVPNIRNAFSGGGGSTGRNPALGYGESTGGFFNGIELGGDGNGKFGEGVGNFGTKNTGSGGGAGNFRGGAGSSGIVIIRIAYRILPLEFQTIEANFQKEKKDVLLKWETFEEWETSHFEVERSTDTVKSWVKIGMVEGIGFSAGPVEYRFIDNTFPITGENLFYRLKQIDFNGKFGYSKVVSVRLPSSQVTKNVWRTFPNPTSGERFSFELLDRSKYQNEKIHVRLISPNAGFRAYFGTNIPRLSVALQKAILQSPNGIYVLEVSWGQNVEYIKVLVRD
ncbi:glycine-rich domain-containing protein [Rhodonellum sp.]|uniref:glycine-rich domain-containing protein n=1 Tax=Rhodonellum sp. TaxID=2231180 RepID=UPI00271A4B4A|nr:hypothetical protein [Rhodonellum sp.]MDO9552374.1 hypothetical protein [Rhodonellum sp.]